MKKSPYITFNCEYCGRQTAIGIGYYNRAKNHFCSRACHMKYMNEQLNPTRMTPEVKEKIRQKRSGSGKGDGYLKLYGKHIHRTVMEQKLGRKLLPNEIVHHIDGDKQNNNPDNLMVMTQSEHCKLHFSKNKEVMQP